MSRITAVYKAFKCVESHRYDNIPSKFIKVLNANRTNHSITRRHWNTWP
jgi:hypothetical protein